MNNPSVVTSPPSFFLSLLPLFLLPSNHHNVILKNQIIYRSPTYMLTAAIFYCRHARAFVLPGHSRGFLLVLLLCLGFFCCCCSCLSFALHSLNYITFFFFFTKACKKNDILFEGLFSIKSTVLDKIRENAYKALVKENEPLHVK